MLTLTVNWVKVLPLLALSVMAKQSLHWLAMFKAWTWLLLVLLVPNANGEIVTPFQSTAAVLAELAHPAP